MNPTLLLFSLASPLTLPSRLPIVVLVSGTPPPSTLPPHSLPSTARQQSPQHVFPKTCYLKHPMLFDR
ncbi:hypothetical protein E2C01_037851 [Portunus trituberculatus]|uniref:Secreted protein n=1 Tax=Portunus trituberculatus TaxID=210409 RepID=A0A5B7FFQ2_PORTR|nr:hypothetical protein [Portunus trituberculatus]